MAASWAGQGATAAEGAATPGRGQGWVGTPHGEGLGPGAAAPGRACRTREGRVRACAGRGRAGHAGAAPWRARWGRAGGGAERAGQRAMLGRRGRHGAGLGRRWATRGGGGEERGGAAAGPHAWLGRKERGRDFPFLFFLLSILYLTSTKCIPYGNQANTHKRK
jgi:hypothetical protein